MSDQHKTISFRCDQQLFERLQAEGRRNRTSLSECIRLMLDKSLKEAAQHRADH